MHTKYNPTGNQLPETPHYQDCHTSHNWEVNSHYVRSRKFNSKVIEWSMLHGPIAHVALTQALSFFLFFGDNFCFSEYFSSKRWWSLRLPETIYQTMVIQATIKSMALWLFQSRRSFSSNSKIQIFQPCLPCCSCCLPPSSHH